MTDKFEAGDIVQLVNTDGIGGPPGLLKKDSLYRVVRPVDNMLRLQGVPFDVATARFKQATNGKTEVTSELPKAGTPVNPNGAGAFLKKAAAIVEGSRQQTHGDKERSFEAASKLWEAYLSSRKAGRNAPIQAQDVAALMGLLKIVRSEYGNPGESDHYVDCCGYFALMGELAFARHQTTHDNKAEYKVWVKDGVAIHFCHTCNQKQLCFDRGKCIKIGGRGLG